MGDLYDRRDVRAQEQEIRGQDGRRDRDRGGQEALRRAARYLPVGGSEDLLLAAGLRRRRRELEAARRGLEGLAHRDRRLGCRRASRHDRYLRPVVRGAGARCARSRVAVPRRGGAPAGPGAGRLYADAEGIGHVIVNGREIVRDNTLTGVPAGKILRSGRDTYTVEVPG